MSVSHIVPSSLSFYYSHIPLQKSVCVPIPQPDILSISPGPRGCSCLHVDAPAPSWGFWESVEPLFRQARQQLPLKVKLFLGPHLSISEACSAWPGP